MTTSILQWNVWYKEDPQKIATLIHTLNPDIVCAQELIQHHTATPPLDTAKGIAQQIGYDYIYGIADTWSNRPDKDNQGNAIFSKHPIRNSSTLQVQLPKHNPPDPEHEGRVYVEVEITVNNKPLIIGTTHLSFTPRFEITKYRQTEVDNLIKILKQRPKNFIFTADLNSTPDSYTLKHLLSLDHLKPAGPDFNQNTWTTKPFNHGGFIEDKLNWRLDYVFATQDIKVLKSEIINTPVSDHLPILLKITL